VPRLVTSARDLPYLICLLKYQNSEFRTSREIFRSHVTFESAVLYLNNWGKKKEKEKEREKREKKEREREEKEEREERKKVKEVVIGLLSVD
jgi:hypothetical protein